MSVFIYIHYKWDPRNGRAAARDLDNGRLPRQAPNYYGQPVMICGIEKPQEPEIIEISSDD